MATRVSTGDAAVDEAAELMINLFWRGLKGKPSETGGLGEPPPRRAGGERTDPVVDQDAPAVAAN